MERAIIYYAKTGLEATDHFVPKLLEKYCQDNGYEIVAMLSEPASTEGVSFPMKYAIIGLNMEEDVNTIITLSKDMIGATDETVIDTLGKLSEYDIYVEDINGELEECYEMMYKEPVQESDIRGLQIGGNMQDSKEKQCLIFVRNNANDTADRIEAYAKKSGMEVVETVFNTDKKAVERLRYYIERDAIICVLVRDVVDISMELNEIKAVMTLAAEHGISINAESRGYEPALISFE